MTQVSITVGSPSRRAPLLPIATLAAALALAGCAAISGLEKARAMPPEEIAQQTDEFVCERLRAFGYVSDVPVNWLREAQKRDLENCIDQGMARRRAEDSQQQRFGCDRFAVSAAYRCW